jgi:tetratricopeptide (TPR) repeat protein
MPQVIAGAACGFLLAVPIGQMSSAPPGLGILLVGFPLASLAVVLLWRWMEGGRLWGLVPAVGVAVLLVNLLAAGGIGFPGVAGTLWLLMAVGLCFTDEARAHVLPRAGARVGLGVVVALLLACWATGFNPVARSQTAMRLAELDLAERDPRGAEEHWKAAAAADPLSAEPRQLLARLAFERWTVQGGNDAFEEFESHMKAAVELAPDSAKTWRVRGECYWEAFRRTGREDTLQGAVRAHRRAVELYPTSAVNRANLAIALEAAGDQGGFREQATIALRLDEGTPHSDKKLDDNLRDELRRGLSRSSS